MAKVAVVTVPFILTIEHFDVMAATIISLLKNKHPHTLDLIAIINEFKLGKEQYEWVQQSFDYVETNDQNILARAWNKGVTKGFERGADYCLVINLDLLFHSAYLENLIDFAEKNPQPIMWSGLEHADPLTLEDAALEGNDEMHAAFCAFLIDRRLFQTVGKFDEAFRPAYHEDSDMSYRIRLNGQSMLSTPTARFYHHDRFTLNNAVANKDAKVVQTIIDAMDRAGIYYKEKWGGSPGQEQYKVPFNKA